MSMLMHEAYPKLYEEPNVRKDNQKAYSSSIVNAEISVAKGSPLFKARVRQALEELQISGYAAIDKYPLPAKFIIASDRVVYDDTLGILYLNRKLKKDEMKDINRTYEDILNFIRLIYSML